MMRFVGIDIGGERHALAVVDEDGTVLTKSTFFGEEAAGYRRLRELLGNPNDCLVAMEATGHYWRNLFAFLASLGFEVALLIPCARDVSPRRNSRGPRPTRLMRSGLRASRRRSGQHLRR